jgi:hypothetical protein
MLLYADEDFAFPVVEYMRHYGHDVLTVQEDSHCGAADAVVLARASVLTRAVLTNNRRHFELLHKKGLPHHGILSATRDGDFEALAKRIDAALGNQVPGRWCIRVNKPAKP